MKPKNAILRWMHVSGAILALSFSLAPQGKAQSNFVSFDYPGATHTDATGVSPSGNIVGRYFNADGSQHGFLLADGKFSSIDYPDAIQTDVTAMNPRGKIVGSFIDAANHGHGFVLSGGNFTAFDFPNSIFTDGFGIGANGDIIGIYGDSSGTAHGFLLRKGTFTTIDVPGASGSLPAMIAAGRIVGGYFLNNHTHGFQLYKGQFTTIDCAGSTGSPGFQFFSGVDPIGRIVGGYGTSDGLTHGSLIIEGNCITIDIPPGTNTYANAIDAEGDIVGRYTGSDGAIHGFLLRKFVRGTTTP
jgi:uncharacterized membrane protein